MGKLQVATEESSSRQQEAAVEHELCIWWVDIDRCLRVTSNAIMPEVLRGLPLTDARKGNPNQTSIYIRHRT